MTCFLCEQGFPITVDGWHYGSQPKGMIPTTLCSKVPFVVEKARQRNDAWLGAACDLIEKLRSENARLLKSEKGAAHLREALINIIHLSNTYADGEVIPVAQGALAAPPLAHVSWSG